MTAPYRPDRSSWAQRTACPRTPPRKTRLCQQEHARSHLYRHLPNGHPADLNKYVLNSFYTKCPPFHVTVYFSTAGTPRGRPDHGASTRSRPGRCHRRHTKLIEGTLQPFLGTRAGPTAPPAPHPSLLVGHPFAAPPDQPLIPPDAHRGHTPRTIAVPGRNLPRSRVQPRPAHSLAQRIQLFNSSGPGTPLVQGPQWPLVVGQVAHRTSTDNSSTDSYIVRFLDDPGPIRIDLLPSFYNTSRSPV